MISAPHTLQVGFEGRVVILPPMPPERQAYALARYSRSADSIADSLRWVHAHSSERFWEKFYFEYGHASIADLGHLSVCLEGISELAAAEFLHEALLDAQQKSTRYQDFGAVPVVFPQIGGDACEGSVASSIAGGLAPESQVLFNTTTTKLLAAYREVFEAELRALAIAHPRPDGMDPDRHQRTLAARAFDVARYLLPMGAATNLGTVMSVRTLERTIGRLLVSPYAEVRNLAAKLTCACRAAPDTTWNDLTGVDLSIEPLAPTLARHAVAHEYATQVRNRAQRVVLDLGLGDPRRWEIRINDREVQAACMVGGHTIMAAPIGSVDLLPPHGVADEILATLLYRASKLRYRAVLAVVQEIGSERRDALLAQIIGNRGPHDEPPREWRAGLPFLFDVAMDWGGWRDLHRHRRCEQFVQTLDLEGGYGLPPETAASESVARIREAYSLAILAAKELSSVSPEVAHYVLPFAHQVRCLFKMDFAEVQYITQLRTSPKGHDSYRTIAWAMAQAASKAEPSLAPYIVATSPAVRDPLIR